MTTATIDPSAAPPLADAASRARNAAILGGALAQLLTRDEDRPARWLAPAFAETVEEERRRLRGTLRSGHAAPADAVGPLSFGQAVALLGRDPRSVAVAIRRLEVTRSTVLPTWRELARNGLPALALRLEASHWFG